MDFGAEAKVGGQRAAHHPDVGLKAAPEVEYEPSKMDEQDLKLDTRKRIPRLQ